MPFITSKTAYQILLKSLVRPATVPSSLESSLQLTNADWKKIYTLPRLTTMESSLCSFQYKILNNVLFLNERLYKFNVVTSPLCSLCKVENESVSHLFCYCRETRSLWQHVQKWLPDYGKLPHLEPQLIILGIRDDDKPDNILINHMILLFKRYICLKKEDQNGLSLHGLTAFFKMIEIIERRIA